MREEVKLRLLMNIINEVTRKYNELLHNYKILLKETEFEATHDPLTGLFNRTALEQLFKYEKNRADVLGRKVAFLFIDLDNFKSVNDRYGHAEGDRVLREIARIIRESIRGSDIAVRIGGDEFLIILPNSDVKASKSVGERIRKVIEETFRSYKISASYGISIYPDEGKSLKKLIDLADKRMYEMKKNRRIKDQAVF
ncbi:MAG: hypothetical protein DSY32_01680 [Aquifex sp.]|nr:MAG: hypothetical protein DSY32_01680 [Aquifex sp.]